MCKYNKKAWSIISWIMVLALLVNTSLVCGISVAAQQEDNDLIENNSNSNKIQTLLDKSVEWVKNTQYADGYWGNSCIINDTCYGIQLLSDNNIDVESALIWLSNKEIVDNNDMLARKLVSTKQQVYADRIISAQNSDGSFGINNKYSGNVFDSCIVLESLVEFNQPKYNDAIMNIINYLYSMQNEDGGWSYNNINNSDYCVTQRISYGIGKFLYNNNLESTELDNAMEKSDYFLQNVDTTDLSENNFEIALLKNIYCYQFSKYTTEDVNNVIDKLSETQDENGSFYGSMYYTYLACKYLGMIDTPENKPNISAFNVQLDKNNIYVNKNSTVTGTYTLEYTSTINKKYSIVTTILDGDNIIYSESNELIISKDSTTLTGNAFKYTVIPEKLTKLNVVTKLMDNDEVISIDENEIIVNENTSLSDVLIIQNTLPWTSNAAEQTLNKLNINYDKITAESALEKDLSIYRMIYVSNDQKNSFYETMYKLKDKLDSFVADGGTLIYGVCDSGWGQGISKEIIPGDVKIKEVCYEYYNYIYDYNHPIVTAELSDNIPLTNTYLYNNYASHRYFDVNTLPENSKIILTAGDNKPTLIEYPIGNGVVIGSTLTWEHSYTHRSNMFGIRAFDDLMLYAYNIVFVDKEFEFTSNISTNKVEYQSAEDVEINVASQVSAYQCRATGVLEIVDINGNVVENVTEPFVSVVYADNSWSNSFVWNTKDIAVGDYIARISWYTNEDLLCVEECNFSIVSDGTVTDTIKTDKKHYKPDEEILVTDLITNNSTNMFGSDLTLEITVSPITDSTNSMVNLSKELSLSPGAKYTYKDYISAKKLGLGNYIVESKVYSANELLCTNSTTFTIEEHTELNEKYSGTISVSKNTDKDQLFNYSVTNTGNVDGENLTIKVAICNDDGSEIDSIEKIVDLKSDDIVNYSELFNTEALAIGNYPVILSLKTDNGDEIILDSNGFEINIINKYIVTFIDDNGAVIDTQQVEYGSSATAPKSPEKAPTQQYTYTFYKWDTDFTKITKDTTVTAIYKATANKYTVTFADDNGTVIDTQSVEYGSSAKAPANPQKPSTPQYTYTFDKWDVDYTYITSDITVKAVYKSTINSYTVKFVNDDGAVLSTQQVEYGKSAIAPEAPVKDSDGQYEYTFEKWDKDYSTVTENIVVTAIYTPVKIVPLPTDAPTEAPTDAPTTAPTEAPTQVVTEESPTEVTEITTEKATQKATEPTAPTDKPISTEKPIANTGDITYKLIFLLTSIMLAGVGITFILYKSKNMATE